MEFETQDPRGDLDQGTRWTRIFDTPHTVRVIHGLYESPGVSGDDLIIWTTEKNGYANPRPFSGRRRSFRRWEPAKEPQFELGHTYRWIPLADQIMTDRTYRIIYVFGAGPKDGLALALAENETIELEQSARHLYEDVTGEKS